jgi:hypothetical protein
MEVSLAGIDYCRPDNSAEKFLENDLRYAASELPDLSDSDTEIESDGESGFPTFLDAAHIGSLIEDPMPGEEEDLVFNERTRTFDTKPSIVSLFSCPSDYPGHLYSVMCGYAENVSENIWKEYVDVAAQHGYLVGAGSTLAIEQEANILLSFWAYHVQLNHPAPSAMLGLLQRSLPCGLLLPKTKRDAVLGQECEHCDRQNRGRTPGLPVAAIPSVLSPGESQHVDIGYVKHPQGNMHSALIAIDRYSDLVEAKAIPSAKDILETNLDMLSIIYKQVTYDLGSNFD